MNKRLLFWKRRPPVKDIVSDRFLPICLSFVRHNTQSNQEYEEIVKIAKCIYIQILRAEDRGQSGKAWSEALTVAFNLFKTRIDAVK